MGKAWNLVCIKMRPEVGAFDVRTQHKLQGEGLGFHHFKVFFALLCAFPFQHSYALQHDQLYHLFNDFILKGNVQSLPKILKIHFIHS